MTRQRIQGNGPSSMSSLPLAAQAQVACTTPLSKTASLMGAQAPTPSDKHRPPGRVGRAARVAAVAAMDKYNLRQHLNIERQPLGERYLQASVPGDRSTARELKESPPCATVVEPAAPPSRQAPARHARADMLQQSHSYVPPGTCAASSYTPPVLLAASSYTPPPQQSASYVPAPVAVVSYMPPTASAAQSPSMATMSGSPGPSRLAGPCSPSSRGGVYSVVGRMASVHAVPASWRGASYVVA